MKKTTKIRLFLFIGSVITIFIVAAFLVILNINEPSEYTAFPFSVLAILTVIACIALALFFYKGPVFDVFGNMESVNINAMLLTVIIIIQISFFFEIISVRNQIINYKLFENIRNDITAASQCSVDSLNSVLSGLCTEEITEISVIDPQGNVLYSSDSSRLGMSVSDSSYTYSFNKPNRIRFTVDQLHIRKQLKSIILNLLTVLVTSVFFSVEIVLLLIRRISRAMAIPATADPTEESLELDIPDDDDFNSGDALAQSHVPSALYYIRQIAFLFYFASRLSSAFIPIVAKSLYTESFGISAHTAAGLPQSAETLLTCSAIFITTILLEKKGWKMPFLSGLLMVAAGTFFSAVSGNLITFVASRAIVGLGYGFCWMTLRNLSLFGKSAREQLLGFALLNAGIYAGMNCGASIGAIIADLFGYKTVFIISAVLTIFTSVFIINLENAMLPKADKSKMESNSSIKTKPVDIFTALLFVILMIAPASIAASFLSYYLPLYFENIGGSITDVGRAQMLYGILLVYVGPALSLVISTFKGKTLENINFVYNLLIALSLFLPGVGTGLLLPFLSASLLGVADSIGFGVQNNYFLSLPAVRSLGASKSLSLLSFIKKLLEMTGPFVFAAVLILGYQAGIKCLATAFFIMTAIFIFYSCVLGNRSSAENRSTGE
ncbi:arabinose efflux permease family protein [Lachnospiraceae bacterium JC7]|nr:arabinose efflux permease family protein [Lachnospiraceae bacterium JC7]